MWGIWDTIKPIGGSNTTGREANTKHIVECPTINQVMSHRVNPCNAELVLFNPLTAKLFNLNFHPLEVVSR